jgi:hypothetical protein
MGELSIFEKIRARNRMLEAVGTEPVTTAPAPSPKPKGTKRVPTRDPNTGKIVWIDVPED